MSFLDLPVEIQLTILSYLLFSDLVHCGATCKHLHQLIRSHPQFQLVIELGAAGCVDNPDNGAKMVDKMGVLADQVRSWSCMHWRQRRLIPIDHTNRKSKLVDGVYYHICDTTSQVDQTVLPMDYEKEETFVVWDRLPSRRIGHDGSLNMHRFNGILGDFAVDESQDLIAGITFGQYGTPGMSEMRCVMEFHRFHGEGERPHDLAAKSIVEIPCIASLTQQYITTVHMSGTSIGVLYTRSSENFVMGATDVFILYDWRTGVKLAHMNSSQCDEYWETFCFISSNAILMPSTFTGTFNVFTFTDQAMSLTHAMTFLLPETKHKPGLRHIQVAAHPSPVIKEPGARREDEPPYLTNPDDSIVVFKLDYLYPQAGNYASNLNLPQAVVAPLRVFRSALAIVENSHRAAMQAQLPYWYSSPFFDWPCPATDHPRTGYKPCSHKYQYEYCSRNKLLKRTPHIHAENWVKHTRWGLELSSGPLEQCVHGTRYLTLASYHDMPDEQASALTLYDFNLRNARRPEADKLLLEPNELPENTAKEELEDWLEQWGDYFDEDDDRRWPVSGPSCVVTPSKIDIPEVFVAPFESAMPYRIVESDHVFRWDSAVLDGERIVGLEYNDESFESVELLDVLVL